MTNQGGFMNCYKICLTKSLTCFMIGVSIYSINSTIAESTELPDPSYSDNVRGETETIRNLKFHRYKKWFKCKHWRCSYEPPKLV